MNCEYCNKNFTSKSSLNIHKSKAKYCLKIQYNLGLLKDNNIQDINIENINAESIDDIKFTCNVCKKKLSNKINLIGHLEKICLQGIFNNTLKINELIKEKDNIINEKEKEINFLKNINNVYDKENYALKEINKVLEIDHELLHDIAKQPKIVNNTTNNMNKTLNLVSALNFSDKNHIKSIIDNNYSLDYILSGQKGCAKFAFENIIKDENGNLKYICSDASRHVYKYKDEYGNIQKDIDAKKLTNFLVEGGIKDKACNIASEWWTEDSGKVNIDKFETLIDKATSIKILQDDNSEFKKELTAMISI